MIPPFPLAPFAPDDDDEPENLLPVLPLSIPEITPLALPEKPLDPAENPFELPAPLELPENPFELPEKLFKLPENPLELPADNPLALPVDKPVSNPIDKPASNPVVSDEYPLPAIPLAEPLDETCTDTSSNGATPLVTPDALDPNDAESE